ncbi:hypothetical protein GCM10010116_36430 [Microbispora rosea subsp. aerata]|nr:hypothetical protein GCM10010116_36430 [Microbispora rosea subsp. aerata]GIH56721.1 hypothetical protein Mro02_36350 [Microbispora rosea subsp. aerata]GLJ82094.1 hypothetical protein GCM10017588_08190 [Microbispora rosea subsp. aerata]
MPIPQARTLAEARLYLALTVDEDGREEPPVEGPRAWTVRSGDVEVLVPYASEAEARDEGERFGVGLSELLDPGQWRLAAAGYARRALADDLEYAEEPGDECLFLRVVSGWETAADALKETLKFIPPAEDEVPAEAFWTEEGRAARAAEPESFLRERLVEDIAFYQRHLDDFRRLNG